MIRNLFIIAGAAMVLCLACLGGAAALGGRALADNDWTWVITDDGNGDDDFHMERGDAGPDITRTLAWHGDRKLTIETSADVTYVQGPEAKVVVTGPKSAVERVRLVNGVLSLEDSDRTERGYLSIGPNGIRVWSDTERLKITVTAPSVDTIRVDGSSDVTVEGYDRPSFELYLDGSGDVKATGKTGKLTLRINGSGDADLDGLEVSDATIEVAGSGDTSVGPTGAATVEISGSGDVDLTRKPRSLERNISGSGEVSGG